MKDELLIEMDTSWYVFNFMVHDILHEGGLSTNIAAMIRQTPYANSTTHKEPD